MCECRYYGKCAGNCDSRGLVLGFGNETYDCDDFQPMPDAEALVKLTGIDRDALLALADELEEYARWEVHSGSRRLRDVCDRIRKALGVSDD